MRDGAISKVPDRKGAASLLDTAPAALSACGTTMRYYEGLTAAAPEGDDGASACRAGNQIVRGVVEADCTGIAAACCKRYARGLKPHIVILWLQLWF